ncbi:cytochrome P450 [Karstenula rhodostoma CBS 690.94]|uniref:Cytochrome P450 n=1 Tax=Karstenula rhodostoma CBS 690.94 TaxID=1392251 RepID=A0A9P4UGZ0_9PLEO|nr:cytochrome P450 [Karstenula rhodostoma CBS 690.94]
MLFSILWLSQSLFSYDDDLPIVNRNWALEPRIFSRWRWAFGSEKILDAAYSKYKGRPYRLARGDVDIVILPDEFIGELNKMPQSAITSRKILSSSMTGYLNGMNVLDKTHHHFRMLLTRGTPALPELLPSIMSRVQSATKNIFPHDTHSWTEVRLMTQIVRSIGQVVTLVTLGSSMCDNPELIRLSCEHSTNAFAITFLMRLAPRFLQPILVWLTPFKWRLERGWKRLEDIVVSETQYRKQDPATRCKNPDLLSWMIAEAKTKEEADGCTLTRIIGSVFAAGIWSTAAFIAGVLTDLAAHPHFLTEIRQEIRDKHERIGGNWDALAFNSLDKLDSAMKETVRFAPGTMLVYSRNIEEPITLSNGLQLQPGQTISTSGRSRAMDASVFCSPRQYDALRSYNEDLQKHRTQPFRSIEGKDHRWGVGRWACPGRNLASLLSKVVLVKLLDEYDFAFKTDKNGAMKQPKAPIMHEFVLMSPKATVLVRRREQNSGIFY